MGRTSLLKDGAVRNYMYNVSHKTICTQCLLGAIYEPRQCSEETAFSCTSNIPCPQKKQYNDYRPLRSSCITVAILRITMCSYHIIRHRVMSTQAAVVEEERGLSGRRGSSLRRVTLDQARSPRRRGGREWKGKRRRGGGSDGREGRRQRGATTRQGSRRQDPVVRAVVLLLDGGGGVGGGRDASAGVQDNEEAPQFRTTRSLSCRSASQLSSYDIAAALQTINHIVMSKSMREQKATRLVGLEDALTSPRKRSDKVGPRCPLPACLKRRSQLRFDFGSTAVRSHVKGH